ncbi:MAG: hypothetical protein U0457_02270 [Candidatus Sericytochromatia bacterium]
MNSKIKIFLVSSLVLSLTLFSCKPPANETKKPDAKPSETPRNDEDTPTKQNPETGQTEMPKEPMDTSEPAPAPKTPIEANAATPMAIKAVAKTTSFVSPASLGNIKGNYVTIELTWQPVVGAKEYWLYKTGLPTKENAQRGNAYKIVNATSFLGAYFLDGALPPSFTGGNIWEKIKKGFSAITLKPGQEYKYKVFAVDEDEKVIGESDAATTIPLPPIAAPTKLDFDPSSYDDAKKITTSPSFVWDTTEGIEPDGYFISVHPPILFGKQAADQQGSFGYAYWSTFRGPKTKVARYGSQSDNALAYPGTFPFDVTFPLKMNGRYSYSVTAVKTDTNDMRTAKAISKSWSDSKIFQVGGGALNAIGNNTNTSNTSSTANNNNTTTSSSNNNSQTQEECNWWCKIKKGASSLVN